jgi:predicted alpha/beta hydrolase
MDVETLLKYRGQCQPLAKGYRKQLEELMKDQGYQDFYAVVDAMLRENIRLEQESITL